MNFLHRGKPSFPQTHLAERMCRGVSVTDTSPRMTVLLVYIRGSFVLVILAAFFYAVLVAVLSITEVWTTWVGTRSLWFVWHAASPFHDKSHRGTAPVMALDVFFGIVIIPYVPTVFQCLFVSTLCRGLDVAFFQRTLVEFMRIPQVIPHLHRDLLPGFEA